jgi:hypothetical protein
MRRSDPELVAQFRACLRSKRKARRDRPWTSAALLLLALCCAAGAGTGLALSVGIAAGAGAGAAVACVLAWYLARTPIVREWRVTGVRPIHR